MVGEGTCIFTDDRLYHVYCQSGLMHDTGVLQWYDGSKDDKGCNNQIVKNLMIMKCEARKKMSMITDMLTFTKTVPRTSWRMIRYIGGIHSEQKTMPMKCLSETMTALTARKKCGSLSQRVTWTPNKLFAGTQLRKRETHCRCM